MFTKPLPQSGNGRSAKVYFRLVGIVLFGFFLLPLLVKSAAQEHASQPVIAVQLLIGSLGLLVVHLATKGDITFSKHEWLQVMGMAVMGVTLYRALSRYALTVARSGSLSNLGVLVLLTTIPVLICALYTIGKRQAVSGWRWLAAILSSAGVLLSLSSLNFGWNGETVLIGLAAACALAGYTLLAESLLKRHRALKIAAVSTSMGTLLIFMVSIGGLIHQEWSALSWSSLVSTGLFTIGIGYMAWNYAIQRVGSLRTTIYVNSAIIFSGYVVYLLSTLSAAVVGLALLMISVALMHTPASS